MKHWFLNLIWWQRVVFIVSISILSIHLAAFAGLKLIVPIIGWDEGFQQLSSFSIADRLEGHLIKWDAGYYLKVAQEGYEIGGFDKAFFPAYPLIIRFVTGFSGLSPIWTSQVISILCFIAGALLLFKTVLLDFREEVAVWAVLWFVFSPLAFFLIAPYPESMFIALSITSYYFARRGWFIPAGIAIAVAGAARPVAFLLAIPFFIEFVQQRTFSYAQILRMGIGALIAPVGVLEYLIFLIRMEHTPNILAVYANSQSAGWSRSITWPWESLFDQLKALLFGQGINPDWFSRVVVGHDLTYAIFGMVCAVWSLKHIRLSMALYLVCAMIFFYCNHGPYGYAFWSIPRWVITLFPLYMVMALWTLKLPKPLRYLAILLSILGLGILSAWFSTGRWVA